MSGEDQRTRRPTHSYGTRFRQRLDARHSGLSTVQEGDEDNEEEEESLSPGNPPNSPVGEIEEEPVANQEVGQSSSSVIQNKRLPQMFLSLGNLLTI